MGNDLSLKIRNIVKGAKKFTIEKPWLTASVAVKEFCHRKYASVGPNRGLFSLSDEAYFTSRALLLGPISTEA
jgi:hypothetical protein